MERDLTQPGVPYSAPGALEGALRRAADAVRSAEALLITAGAGMSADSGIPTFRDPGGIWCTPESHAAGVLSRWGTPYLYREDPAAAWGPHMLRLRQYRAATPHSGYLTLARWSRRMRWGAFVATSNVDGLFARSGFDRIWECHGSAHHVQCVERCGAPIATADALEIEVDPHTRRAVGPTPRCECGAPARPAILFFEDGEWDDRRSRGQGDLLQQWLEMTRNRPTTVIEIGSAPAIPTIRMLSERLHDDGAALIRINPEHYSGPDDTIRIPLTGELALARIRSVLRQEG